MNLESELRELFGRTGEAPWPGERTAYDRFLRPPVPRSSGWSPSTLPATSPGARPSSTAMNPSAGPARRPGSTLLAAARGGGGGGW
jgi:hypothetical protein